MEVEKVVENIQRVCKEKGTNPTEAGRESGAGKDLVSLMKRRGILPSVEKMSLLAAYLGVTTSELLGEEKGPAPVPEGEPNINVIKIAGRDGTFLERSLTDDQLKALTLMLDQLPSADDL